MTTVAIDRWHKIVAACVAAGIGPSPLTFIAMRIGADAGLGHLAPLVASGLGIPEDQLEMLVPPHRLSN